MSFCGRTLQYSFIQVPHIPREFLVAGIWPAFTNEILGSNAVVFRFLVFVFWVCVMSSRMSSTSRAAPQDLDRAPKAVSESLGFSLKGRAKGSLCLLSFLCAPRLKAYLLAMRPSHREIPNNRILGIFTVACSGFRSSHKATSPSKTRIDTDKFQL